MVLTFELQIYCKGCDSGDFITISANSKKDVESIQTNCKICKYIISVGMFLFDDLNVTELLKKESLNHKFLTNQLSDEEFWEVLNQ